MTGIVAGTAGAVENFYASYNKPATINLGITVAFYNGVVRLLAALQIDVEDDYRRFLDEFPLPVGGKR